ncbi:MAG TPA: glycoside hydrolase domain-containing protein [Puia sp.]|nr:glycoside hydrolase domain-containing protein [Puia sp.]
MQKLILFIILLSATHFVRAQALSYSNCPGCWNADTLGNHRIVVQCNGAGNVARVVIPWRRRDIHPENKRIIVQDSATGKIVLNKATGVINRESGELFFEPVSGKGIYYIYYMPYRNEGRSNYPRGVYWKPDTTATAGWLGQVKGASGKTVKGAARTVACKALVEQSIDAFNSFYPMEVIATSKETDALVNANKGKAFLVFPEDRERSIRMRNDLPYQWISTGAGMVQDNVGIVATVDKGEYYAYQLGVYALKDMQDVKVSFSDMRGPGGVKITSDRISCINTNGVRYDGTSFIKRVDIPERQVQALWCGVDIPADARPGNYAGTATVEAGGQRRTIRVLIRISNAMATDQPEKMTRLKWLNSTLAQANDVIAPYTPLTVEGDSLVNLLGRQIQVNRQGFPEQIRTFFTPEMTDMGTTPNNLLAENIHFHFTGQEDGKDIRLVSQGVHFTRKEAGTVEWNATNIAEELQMDVNASLEFDGYLDYKVKVTALQDIDLKDITMHIPFQPEKAKYMMGLGLKGGYRPDSLYQWKWDVAHKNQDGAWIGTVNAGLQYSLRDEHYVRPLNTNFYLQKPLLLPTSWGNDGKGGIAVGIKGKSMLANNYSGARHMKKGDILYYNFHLLITPFHVLNTDFQWVTRFYHKYNNLDTIKATGATVVNIHHATPINPWINYPFIEWKRMKGYIDSAHSLGLKVKIYNTVRELSDRAYELFALRSLGDEIYSRGPGGGFSWLQEHVGDDYIPAWFVPEIKDAAIINSGMSRWHNYYVEGMNWLVQQAGIDGIYLDDVAFDRVTMKRIKRVLTQDGHPGIIDLHSANQYNPRDGYNNSANLYMEHFPYLNRLWFGEYFDYEKNTPDFFLTEVSGIPFGLMGEMLEGGGNPWRGLVYGMTNRMPWTENADPRPIWKVWDEFGMRGTQMIGYWSPSCPVTTGRADVPVTVWLKKGKALLSLASWAKEDTVVRLQIDWQRLGIDAAHARIKAPDVKNFQVGRSFRTDEDIPVAKGKGWLLVIE